MNEYDLNPENYMRMKIALNANTNSNGLANVLNPGAYKRSNNVEQEILKSFKPNRRSNQDMLMANIGTNIGGVDLRGDVSYDVRNEDVTMNGLSAALNNIAGGNFKVDYQPVMGRMGQEHIGAKYTRRF